VGRFLFFLFGPVFFVITCVMINQSFLLVLLLLTFALASFMSRPGHLLNQCPWLGKVALVGDGLKTLVKIHDFYQENPARSFLYYLCYPLTGPIAALVSPAARQEGRLYLGILGTLLFAILVETVLTYRSVFPPHLSVGDAVVWVIVRAFFSFLLVLGLLVPVAATTFSYRRTGKKWQLRALAWVGLASAVYSVSYYYATTHAGVSFLSSEHLALRMDRPSFRTALREPTELFLMHHAARLSPPADLNPRVEPELTRKYQVLIGKLAVDDEARAFSVFTLPAAGNSAWLGVRVKYSENTRHLPALVALVHPRFGLFTSWHSLPHDARSRFHVSERPAGPGDTNDLLHLGKATLIDDLP
jgi:hypothetical protein